MEIKYPFIEKRFKYNSSNCGLEREVIYNNHIDSIEKWYGYNGYLLCEFKRINEVRNGISFWYLEEEGLEDIITYKNNLSHGVRIEFDGWYFYNIKTFS